MSLPTAYAAKEPTLGAFRSSKGNADFQMAAARYAHLVKHGRASANLSCRKLIQPEKTREEHVTNNLWFLPTSSSYLQTHFCSCLCISIMLLAISTLSQASSPSHSSHSTHIPLTAPTAHCLSFSDRRVPPSSF